MSETSNKSANHKDWIGPFVLIFFGSIFFLQNFNYLPQNIWREIWKYWPVFFIIMGLQIITQNSSSSNKRQTLIFTLLIALLTITSIAISSRHFTNKIQDVLPDNLNSTLFQDSNNKSFQQKKFTISASKYNQDQLNSRQINLNLGVGKLNLSDKNQSEYLKIDSDLHNLSDLNLNHTLNNSQLVINLDTKARHIFNQRSEHTTTINQLPLPTSINLDIGAGSTELEFSQINLDQIDINLGVGSAQLTITPEATISGQLDVDIGVGSLDLQIPDSLGFQIDHKVGLGNIQLNNQPIKKHSPYTSDNFQQATQTLQIKANIGIGSINVSTVE